MLHIFWSDLLQKCHITRFQSKYCTLFVVKDSKKLYIFQSNKGPFTNYVSMILQFFAKLPIDHFGTEHFGKSHFGTNVSSREHFGTCTVGRCGRSGRWTFQHRNVSTLGIFGTGNFRHQEFSAPEHFGTGIFRHLNISAHGYFGTLQSNMDFSAQTFRHLCYSAEISMC